MVLTRLFEVAAIAVAVSQPVAEATVRGVVRDEASGTPLAGVEVALGDAGRRTITGPDGVYAFAAVPVGPQHVVVRRLGYVARTLHALVPLAGTLVIDVTLRADPVRLGRVTIESRVPVRGIAVAEHAAVADRTMTREALADHPQLGDADALLALDGGEVHVRPEVPAGVHLRGAYADQTAYTLDGIPIFNPYHAAGSFAAWNADALASLRVVSAAPGPDLPAAIGGTVDAATRQPGANVRAQGGATNTQLRLTLDAPVGSRASVLVSARGAHPGAISPPAEPSYVRGEAGDHIAVARLDAAGGRFHALAYENDNEIDVAVRPPGDTPPLRNVFEWIARSHGVGYARDAESTRWRVLAWRAGSRAAATWRADAADTTPAAALRWSRTETGALASVTRRGTGHDARAGVRLAHDVASAAPIAMLAKGGHWRGTAFAGGRRELGVAAVDATLVATRAAGRTWLGPRGRLTWTPGARAAFEASWDRTQQFAQSLRNTESLAAIVFPVDLFAVADGHAVPVVRADRAVLAASLRPAVGTRIGLQVYHRRFADMLAVATSTGAPFATGAVGTADGTATGASLDVAMSGRRHAVLAGYGVQRVLLRQDARRWTPEHAPAHTAHAGATVHATPTLALKVGVLAIAGRRATPFDGELEWESCNLLDWGCEFGGSPRAAPDAVGASRLPTYARIDVGVRKHWHLHVAGREAPLTLFGSVTNLLGARNVLAYGTGPSGGARALEMRPFAPLVAGLEWGF